MPILLRKLAKIDWGCWQIQAFDWSMVVLSFVVAIYQESELLFCFAVLGAIVSYLRPMLWLQRKILKYKVTRTR
ncbi:hypothetical protein ACFOY8_13145 [Thalassospira xianhensis]|uniref:Uncharacterized protein n=2 Tax=Thalassospira TaxID=168934 RepID=A0A285TUR8_9PROT|nr:MULTISPECIES: hypothetical protein [Thalassospira]RCK07847.1 hypothetical protein TH5_02145 [Thalassospira xianhensis MCCC 1A02616]SOC27228.1 hypothetical protein SAMN05428964_105316 [Thalassospira xiamenensis]